MTGASRPMRFYGHPFSSYCQKALIALYEKGVPFELRMLTPEDEETAAEHARLWPLRRMPVLVDGDRTIAEASIIVEYLDQRHRAGTRLLPVDPDLALDVRMLDRFFDNYVMTPMQRIVFNAIRAPEHRDPYGVDEARRLLDIAYGWINETLSDRTWASGGEFSLADCAAAPALFYADWVHPMGSAHANVQAYRRRLLSRPSFARAVDEARPYRAFFPLGAPDRD